jgi:glycine cleavage system transcriptional repressor
MARFSLHSVGKDRPGIISGIANALAEIGANLEDSQMTILRGLSAVVVVIDAPGIDDGGRIEAALESVAEELNLFVVVRPLPDEITVPQDGQWYSILVDGADRPGIVAKIAEAIVTVRGNIVDLSSRLLELDGRRGYVLRLSITVPSEVTMAELDRVITAASDLLGVSSSVTPGVGDLA